MSSPSKPIRQAVNAPTSIDDLGVDGALYLLALLIAQSHRRAVTPTRQLTLQTLSMLRDQGVIALPWPLPQWEVEPEAERTPFEDLQWRYSWSTCPRHELIERLVTYLEGVPFKEEGIELRLRLWQQLVRAESQQYLEWHLARANLPVEWAVDSQFLLNSSGQALSLGQWRYCLWAGVRHGSTLVAQQVHPLTSIRERMFDEARRRSDAIASGRWTVPGFDARADEPGSALTRVYLEHLAQIGLAFYQLPPSADPWRREMAA
jgi:hypothetical protein